ncbi:MAG: hypothetical protein ACLFQJ_05295 [Campylobacterales bacterium]
MAKLLLKEIAVFAAILLVLAFLIHGGSLPERIEMVIGTPSKIVHAFIWAGFAYMLVFLFRAVFKVIFMRKNERRESK